VNYSELEALPPEAFLDPDRFRTEHDDPDDADEQYQKGLETSRKSESVGIAEGGTWLAKTPTGGLVTTTEGIGYYPNTADLLRGFLDGPAPVIIYRRSDDGYPLYNEGTEIKPRTAPRG